MHKPIHIVIVDDHILLRKGLASLINFFPGYKVLFEASNGKDFINKLNPSDCPDVVLLDINMPEMDGYETADWITAHHSGIKILALSLMNTIAEIEKMILCGAKGVILKDIDPQELRYALNEVIKKGYYHNPSIAMPAGHNWKTRKWEVNKLIDLTERELSLLKLLCGELTHREISQKLSLSEQTVAEDVKTLLQKLKVQTRVGLVMYAINHKILKL
jgi:DNA-binding NarL/FixJ family response regulator